MRALRAALWRDLAPEGALEEVLAHRVALCVWRLARATRAEGELLSQAGQPLRSRVFLDPSDPVAGQLIGATFAESAQDTIDRVNRYEVTLERLLQSNLQELDRAKERRRQGIVASIAEPEISTDASASEAASPNDELAKLIADFSTCR